jgi:hypothetical protein
VSAVGATKQILGFTVLWRDMPARYASLRRMVCWHFNHALAGPSCLIGNHLANPSGPQVILSFPAEGLRSTPSKPMSKTRQTRFVKQEKSTPFTEQENEKALSLD